MSWLSWRTSPRRCIEDVRLFVNPRQWLTCPCSVVFIAVYNKFVILLSKWVTLNAAPCIYSRGILRPQCKVCVLEGPWKSPNRVSGFSHPTGRETRRFGEHSVSVFRVEDESSRLLPNIGAHLSNDTELHSGRPSGLPWIFWRTLMRVNEEYLHLPHADTKMT